MPRTRPFQKKEPVSLKAGLVESQKPCLPSCTRESANERLGYKRGTASLPDGQHGHNKRKSPVLSFPLGRERVELLV